MGIKEEMLSENLYNANYSLELENDRLKAKDLCYEYNTIKPSNLREREQIICNLFSKTKGDFRIEQPFWCDYGYNIEIGQNFYANHNLVILDGNKVTFGDNVFIGPNCAFYTAGHPLDAETRNKGLEYASGDYISYIDSDDWIERDFYEVLMSHILKESAEMVTSGMIYEWPNREERVIDSVDKGTYDKSGIKNHIWGKMAYDFSKNSQGISSSLSNKIIKKDVLESVSKNIDDNIKYCEDGALVYALLTKISKLVVTHYCGYHYIQQEDSAIHTYTTNAFDSILALQHCMEKELLGESENMVLKQQIDMYVTAILRTAINKTYGILISMPTYVFPYHLIPKDSQIILYGAGRVGTWFYRYIEDEVYVTVAAWVDKDYYKYRDLFPVESPKVIEQKKYDYIVIAIEKEEVAREIQKELVQLGVCESKIIWEVPRRIMPM